MASPGHVPSLAPRSHRGASALPSQAAGRVRRCLPQRQEAGPVSGGRDLAALGSPISRKTLGFDGQLSVLVFSHSVSVVTLPPVRPNIVFAYPFAFVLSLNEYIVIYMVAGFTVEALPIKIFSSLRYGYTPVMAVVVVLIALLAALILSLVGRFDNLPRLLGALGPGE